MPRLIRQNTVFPLTVRHLEVTRVTEVSAGMRRVTLSGDQLDAFTREGYAQREFRSTGFDDAIRLVFPYPGETDPVLPAQGDGKLIFAKERRPLAKVYTVRRWDPVKRELDVDFVIHGTGVATTWATRCTPGDRIHVAGPAASSALPTGIDWTLLVGDETALPAIGHWLETVPAGTRAQVFIEVAGPGHEQTVETAADASITWIHRDDDAAPTLLDAIRSAPWWEGSAYAWVAGEATSIKEIRRFLKDDRRVPKDHLDVTGYWRRAEVVTLADDPSIPDQDKTEEHPFDKLHEMMEILPPIAIRAAVTLDLPDLIASGTDSIDALATATSADRRGLHKLLRYLTVIDLTAQIGPDRFELTPTGLELTNEYVQEDLHADSPAAQAERGFAGLLDAVRTGRSVYRDITGRDFTDFRTDHDFEGRYVATAESDSRWLASALAGSVIDETTRRVAIISDGAGAHAQQIVAAGPDTQVVIVGMPTQLDVIEKDLVQSVPDGGHRDRIELRPQSVFEPVTDVDLILVVGVLDQYQDGDAALLLRKLTAAGIGVLVVESPLDESSVDDHVFEEDLLNLTVYGTGHRTDAENRDLIATAGAELVDTRTVGWGSTVYHLQKSAAT